MVVIGCTDRNPAMGKKGVLNNFFFNFSLNQLSEDQMKIVSKALKIFGNPEQEPMEPAYDPVTNTRFIYKYVYLLCILDYYNLTIIVRV